MIVRKAPEDWWGDYGDGLTVYFRTQDGGCVRRQRGEEVVAGVGLQLVDRDEIVCPGSCADARDVRDVDGDDSGGRVDSTDSRSRSVGDDDDDFPDVRRNIDQSSRVDLIRAEAFRSTDDEQFVPCRGQCPTVSFQICPDPLVVVRSLRDDVGHIEYQVIDGSADSAIS